MTDMAGEFWEGQGGNGPQLHLLPPTIKVQKYPSQKLQLILLFYAL